MRRFAITYRYSNPAAAIDFVIASMEMWVGLHMNPAELVAVVESTDSQLRVIGIEAI